MRRPRSPLALLATLLFLAAPVVRGQSAIEESLRLEAEGAALLLEHYEVERAMLSPDPDRLTVFLTLPPGAPVILEEASLLLDGKPVVKHRYTAAELARLADGAAQPLLVGQVAPGEHQLRLEVRTRQGKVQPMGNFTFVKGGSPHFVELQIAGETSRQIRASAW